MSREQILADGLQKMGIGLAAQQQERMLGYLDLLKKWNQAFNLSAVRDEADMVSRHLLDSLALYPLLRAAHAANDGPLRLIDVGSGAGLPGIPLAICFPDMEFILLDSNGKKTRFLFQARLSLDLPNVSIENCRIEHYQSPAQIDIVISRAFSSLAEMLSKTRHLQAADKSRSLRWLAMKGVYPAGEIAALPEGVQVTQALRVEIPGDTGERHIIDMCEAGVGNR